MRKLHWLLIVCIICSSILLMGRINSPFVVSASPNLPASNASQVSTGSYHSCALTNTGGVVCWGYNWAGQLGDNTRIMRTSPTPVNGLANGIQAVTTGQSHSCALTNSGGVKCWGFNFYGQLGDGSNNTIAVPVDVSGLASGVVAIAAGANHTCALTNGGGVKCWGLNTNGQLGNASNSDSNIPVNVNGLLNGVSGIGAGGAHTCSQLSAGGGKCWGSNTGGQLGNGSTSDSNIPVNINTLSGVLNAIDGGDEHTCALTNSGGMFCWGRNNNGRLGDGTFADKTSPVQVSGLTSGVTAVSIGAQHSCAVLNEGLKCWGNNSYGQLGDGTTTGQPSPTDVSGLSSGVVTVSGGEGHTCAVLSSGGLRCWGYNFYGQLGDGTSGLYLAPVTVSGLSSGVNAISAGDSHTCVLTSGGGLKCWGGNNVGQLGNGSNTPSNLPLDVSGLTSGASAVTAGTSHTCALVSGGGVKCWGYNVSGQLGNGNNTTSKVPVTVTGLTSGVTKVSAGGEHSCAITNTGGVKCWGLNDNGQLGNGNNSNSNTPVDVSSLPSTASSVAVGYLHSCALTTTGGVYCWGDNATGQLGTGNTNDSNAPVAVTGLSSGVTAISVGWDHSCAIVSGGGVKCWGKNYSGQLGFSTGGTQNAPVDVANLSSGATSLDGGAAHTCAIVNGGAICWGSNTDGQLGDGTANSTHIPVNVSGLTSGVLNITAGGGHSCAVFSPSEAKCWGSSDDGEIGTGIPIQRTSPVVVIGFDGNGALFLPVVMNN